MEMLPSKISAKSITLELRSTHCPTVDVVNVLSANLTFDICAIKSNECQETQSFVSSNTKISLSGLSEKTCYRIRYQFESPFFMKIIGSGEDTFCTGAKPQ